MESIGDLYDRTLKLKSGRSKVNEADGSPDAKSSDIELVVTPDGDFDVGAGNEVRLEYDFVLDWKTWGIKDIEIGVNADVQFSVTIGGAEIDIAIKPEDVNVSWIGGRHYMPVALYVTMDKDGNVKSADLNVSYIEH